MPDEPKTANTQDLGDTEYDAERWARVHDDCGGTSKNSAPIVEDKPDVGLSQKGTDEAAVVKRETEI